MRGLVSGLGISSLQLRVIALYIAINMLDGFDILAMAYTAPAIAGEWQLDPERLGLLFSLGLGGMMAGSILLAPLADRFGRRPLILACLIAATASMFAASIAASLPSLGAARVLTGLAIGAIVPISPPMQCATGLTETVLRHSKSSPDRQGRKATMKVSTASSATNYTRF